MKLKAGHAIVEALRAEGTEVVFGLPGGHILGVYDGLFDNPDIRHVLVRHEHTAAAMAAGYAQLTGQPGVCIATAGPGATNLLTAVAEAYVGALPLVILTGRATTATAYRGAAQEVSTEKVFAPVTKWAVRADRADLLVDLVRRAFAIARGGKPGPVLIDIPRDLLMEDVEVTDYVPSVSRQRIGGPAAAVEQAASLLSAADRPLIVAGGGAVASGAFAEVAALAEALRAPVLTSMSGRGIIPDDHPLAAGGLGAHRNPLSKRLLPAADVIIGLGTRFEEMETNWRPGYVPSPDAQYIQVDLDATELGRSITARVGVIGDVRTVVSQLLRVLPPAPEDWADDPRVREVTEGVAAIDASADESLADDRVPLSPLRVIRSARRVFPRDTTVATDVGCLSEHIAGSFPYFRVYEPRSFISPSSFYGMGFCTSAVLSAPVVYPDRPALCFSGDGSFQMVLPVLPAAVENKLPVTWCVLDDEALGSIRDLQEYRYDERYLATSFGYQPDLAGIATACGCYGETVTAPGSIAGALERALAANRAGQPAVLDFKVAPDRMEQSREHFMLYRAGEH
ncbi:MAG: thiamine pyrophosphate-binding protein [Streptosporangiaceae bacterium]|jgi:acetolactate synthase-1/2/3 large subunit